VAARQAARVRLLRRTREETRPRDHTHRVSGSGCSTRCADARQRRGTRAQRS
jgi:hypothetical protein